MLLRPQYQPTFAERYPIQLMAAILDFLTVVTSCYVAHYWRFGQVAMDGRYTLTAFLFAFLVVCCFWAFDVYGPWRGKSFLNQLGRLYAGWLAALGIALTLTFSLKVSANYSRQWSFLMLALGVLSSTVLRFAISQFLRWLRSSGRNLKSVVLVYAGGRAAERLGHEEVLRESGYRVSRRLSYEHGEAWEDALVEAVEESKAHEVWLCLPLTAGDSIKRVLYVLRHHVIAVRFIPEWGDIPLLNQKVSNVVGLYSLDLSYSPMDGPARLVKRLEDILIGGAISVAILPACLLIALAIKFTSPGPVVFKQYRTGINGKRFKVYKFRSMVVHQEEGVTQATKNDARVTVVGAFIRRTSLDELPQFFNVLQGRMSIVGPRPHALAHNEYYKDLVESYMQRHKVKPGITGWAQVNGYRGETDTLDKMQRRVEYDLWYIDNWSLWLDIKIIFLTIFKGFISKAAY